VMSLAQPQHARTQDAATVVGAYCLTGVREVGSCIRLSAGGKFEYFLAYGAYDEKSEGTWRLEGGEIIVDSPAYDRRPVFSLKRLQPGETDAFVVIVESKSGRGMIGIDVVVNCEGSSKRAGITQPEGFKTDCASPPTAVSLGLRMYDVAPQTIDVSDRAGSDRAYVFEFDLGDLGRKRFAAHRFRFEDNPLVTVYANSPIKELEGRIFRYVRSR
jgi:hypothetical protein